MGKRQHQKDKMYLTTTEWSQFYGGYKPESHAGASAPFRRLPLNFCALSLGPFSYPYADEDGNIFDLEAILPFIRKFKMNPVTGKPFGEKNLIKLNFHKGSEGEYHCPILFKPFTSSSHVVANAKTGNVFSYEAVKQLNISPSYWKDLITDEPFTRQDIITLQDPRNLDKFNIATFYHIKSDVKVTDDEKEKQSRGAMYRLKTISKDAQDILTELQESYKEQPKEEGKEEAVADKFNAAHYSTGAVAASLTSTSADVAMTQRPAILDDDVVRYQRVKKKGYVSLKVNLGTLNIELYCDSVTKTCENFLQLCKRGYYDSTKFHRSIRHFMIQGGDPTGTGQGGESCWGGTFKDEIRPHFSHKGRGVLSMANSAPNSNKSQFFITFRSCAHLDGKHTIFGRVVGGLGTLSLMEAVETDNKDRPIEDIVILSTVIYVDPFKEVDEQLAEERRKEDERVKEEQDELHNRKRLKPSGDEPSVFRSGVGKFLDLSKCSVSKAELSSAAQKPKKKEGAYKFGDFSVFS